MERTYATAVASTPRDATEGGSLRRLRRVATESALVATPSPRIAICDHGRPLLLDYAGLQGYHGGGAPAGAAIAYRAMAAAGQLLSKDGACWDRQHIAVASWHDGAGVRDAIEYVTRAFSRGSFQLREFIEPDSALAYRAFRFEVGDGSRLVSIALREGVMPLRYFVLAAERHRRPEQQAELAALREQVAATVMRLPQEALFQLQLREARGGATVSREAER